MEENKNTINSSSAEIVRGLLIAGVIIAILIIANITGILGGSEKENSTVPVQNPVVNQQQNINNTPVQQTPAAPIQQETTAAKPQTPPSSLEQSSMTTAEIIALFNKSANAVKTDATKVVKNFENRDHDEEHLVVPEILMNTANDLLEENFKDDTEPIEYLTREDIVNKYQVPDMEWSSQLTEAEVASASCVDNGSEYEITITLHPTDNPQPGEGVAKAFDTITPNEVMEKAPSFVKEFNTKYYDCTVTCKIDKETGRTTWSNYKFSVIIGAGLEFLGMDLNAQVGMSFEKDYTITY